MSKLMSDSDKQVARRLSLQEFAVINVAEENEEDKPQEEAEGITQEEVDRIKQAAYQEGFNQGVRDGTAAAAEQLEAMRERLEYATGLFVRPLEQFDNDVENELVSLSLAVAKQLVRRELKADPSHVIAVVREAMSALPISSQGVKFHLHPEDAALVREVMPPSETEEGWTIVEDPVMQRGGCRVESLNSEIDGTLDGRIAAIAAAILGGERSKDGQ